MAETKWIVPVGSDVSKVVSTILQRKSNENLAATQDNQPVDLDQANRRDALLTTAVHEARAAVLTGGRIALSTNLDAIPPELERHVLNIAAFQLINSQPNLQMFVIGEGGVYAPIQKVYAEAVAFIDTVRKGEPVTPPSEPMEGTGDDGNAGKIDGEYSMETT